MSVVVEAGSSCGWIGRLVGARLRDPWAAASRGEQRCPWSSDSSRGGIASRSASGGSWQECPPQQDAPPTKAAAAQASGTERVHKSRQLSAAAAASPRGRRILRYTAQYRESHTVSRKRNQTQRSPEFLELGGEWLTPASGAGREGGLLGPRDGFSLFCYFFQPQ